MGRKLFFVQARTADFGINGDQGGDTRPCGFNISFNDFQRRSAYAKQIGQDNRILNLYHRVRHCFNSTIPKVSRTL